MIDGAYTESRMENSDTFRRRFTRTIYALVAFAYLIPRCVAGVQVDPPAPAKYRAEAQYGDTGLSIQAENAPLVKLLHAVARASGARLFIRADLSQRVTTTFTRIPLVVALRRLLPNRAFVVVSSTSSGQQERPAVVQEIRVYGRAGINPAAVEIDALTMRRAETATLSETGSEELDSVSGLGAGERLAVIYALAARSDERAIRLLGQMLEVDDDLDVRDAIVSVLLELGGDSAAQALQRGLGDPAPSIRSHIVDALGMTTGQPGTLGLGQVLFGEPDPQIRSSAVAYLAEMGTSAAREFVRAAANDPDKQVRNAAQAALARW